MPKLKQTHDASACFLDVASLETPGSVQCAESGGRLACVMYLFDGARVGLSAKVPLYRNIGGVFSTFLCMF